MPTDSAQLPRDEGFGRVRDVPRKLAVALVDLGEIGHGLPQPVRIDMDLTNAAELHRAVVPRGHGRVSLLVINEAVRQSATIRLIAASSSTRLKGGVSIALFPTWLRQSLMASRPRRTSNGSAG